MSATNRSPHNSSVRSDLSRLHTVRQRCETHLAPDVGRSVLAPSPHHPSVTGLRSRLLASQREAQKQGGAWGGAARPSPHEHTLRSGGLSMWRTLAERSRRQGSSLRRCWDDLSAARRHLAEGEHRDRLGNTVNAVTGGSSPGASPSAWRCSHREVVPQARWCLWRQDVRRGKQ